MTVKFTNQLIHESSPYLLQHAHNPVQWYPWGTEALDKAKELDLPILVSIGYAACHWCHVMERESFEDEEVARYMNEHFINIKIDREERPDLDHIYMDAVQAIAGNGGWPLNVFLTTDAKPFYGGTYFPPQKAYNRPSWKDVLLNIHTAWNDRRDELVQQAQNLVDHISLSGNLFGKKKEVETGNLQARFTTAQCDTIAANILKAADTVDGGFGVAPKFPQTFTIQYLLAHSHFFKDEKALMQAELSIEKMLHGGIYDQLGGGLARYSTDSRWLAPHFEKMLYDNALLVSVMADAYQLTKNKIYEEAVRKTINFFTRDMKHSEGGFFAALDADSEGVEGKFYVWDKKEVDEILGEDASLYCNWFNISEHGNWEEKNILHITADEKLFVEENTISPHALHDLINKCNEKLLNERNKRPKPITDDKILVGWNALFLVALCKASAALGDENYKQEAVQLFNFIKESFFKDGMLMFHTYKNKKATHPAFLDDYAYLIQACIFLQEITADQQYLFHARSLTTYVIENFMNEQTGFFYYTHRTQKDIISRKVEFYDGAVPSGNSMMAENLFYLGSVFEEEHWCSMARKMAGSLVDTVVKYPTSFAAWALVLLKQATGVNEIVLTGKNISQAKTALLKLYIPNKVFQSSDTETNEMPLLKDKSYSAGPLIYLCRDHVCMEPVNKVDELELLLKKPFY